MAPEAPGNLVVLDLRFGENGTLLKTVESVDPPQVEPKSGWLRVRFDEAPDDHFYPVGNGVVHVCQPEGYSHSTAGAASEALSLPGGPRRYKYDNVAHGEGLQLVLILPRGYTVRDFNPVPTSAKEFEGRIAVYFRPIEKYGATATITWQLQSFRRSVRSEAKYLRGEFVKLRQPQTNLGAFLDREDPEFKEPKPAAKQAPKQGLVTEQGSPQPLSARAYGWLALIAGVLGIGLLVFYVLEAPKLDPGLRNQVYYVVLFPSALACAVALFGAMKSYARLRHQHPGGVTELGGPVVLFCLIVYGGFRVVPAAPESFDLTVRVHGAEPLLRSGRITIDLGNDRRTKEINSSAEADFKGIPAEFRGAIVAVLPTIDGYKEEWQHLPIQGNTLDVTLERPLTHLSGTILPPPSNVAALVIMVDGESRQGQVNEFGKFDIEVNKRNGDLVRLKVYDGKKLAFDDFVTIPGPLNLRLNER